jgi:hypothetical protein
MLTEALRSLEHVGKNLTFGGIINDVQHRIAKKRKRLGIFTLDMTKAMSLKIFGENTLSSVIYSKQFYLYESIGQRGRVIRILVKKVNQGYSYM